jgi:hypothetical protein
MSETISSAAEWLRACSLVVADMQGNGIELAGPDQPQILRIRFTVNYWTRDTPASLHARIYNLSATTVQRIVGLASQNGATIVGVPGKTSSRVVLKAGYQANFGQLFEGYVYQIRTGKESNVDSFIDIFAADGDAAHNFGFLSKSLAKGYTSQDVFNHAADSFQQWQVTSNGPPDGLQSQPAPRGKVLFGMTRDTLTDLGESNNFTWNIYQGQLQAYPKFSVRPGEAVVINSSTGQIGVPEQTETGVQVMCLLNPAIAWGTRIKLNNTEIAQLKLAATNATINQRAASPNAAFGNQGAWVPPLNSDGDYVVIYASHVGDTRGDEWFTRITAFSVDPTANTPQATLNVPPPPPLSASAVLGPTPGTTPP